MNVTNRLILSSKQQDRVYFCPIFLQWQISTIATKIILACWFLNHKDLWMSKSSINFLILLLYLLSLSMLRFLNNYILLKTTSPSMSIVVSVVSFPMIKFNALILRYKKLIADYNCYLFLHDICIGQNKEIWYPH